MEVQPAPTVDTAAVAPQPVLASTVGSAQNAQGVTAPQSQPAAGSDPGGIAPAIAKLFGGGDPQPIQLNVSYRVEGNDVVTVFSDPKTGKEIAQFPPELLLGLAKFFDQQSGITLDKTA